MADMFSSGVSGLLAFQNALTTTGHNISNVATPGYSRQRVELGTRPAELQNDFYIGTGVNSQMIRRSYDQLLTEQVRNTGSAAAQMDSYATFAARLDNLLGAQGTSVSPMLSQFFNDLELLAENPAGIPERQVVLTDAELLADRFNALGTQLDQLQTDVNQQITQDVAEINRLSANIAELNGQIVLAQSRTNGAPPNDLLDARDEALRQLGEKVAVQTVAQDDGAVNVFVGTGQALVVGKTATPLTTVANAYDPARLEVAYGSAAGPLISNQITGGSLGGAIAFRRETLDVARNSLGQLALTMAGTVNAQHRMGMDLDGQLGGDLFAVAAPAVLPHRDNSGSAILTAAITDPQAVTSSDYQARYDGSQWEITRLSDGVRTTGSLPLALDGVTFDTTGTPAAGDRFLIQPTAGAADSLSVVLDGPRALAAASPIRTSAALGNTGTGRIDPGIVVDPSDPALLMTTTFEFLTPTTYTINGVGSYTYTAGAPITINGWQIRLEGAPQAGDQFTVEANSGGVGNNHNALALAGLQSQGLLDSGSATYGQHYDSLVVEVANRSRQANLGRDTQRLLADQARAARESVSGVNLDEEAAQMLRFQQAYQAAAQVIATADNLFQTLLEAVRR
ncbi:MAG TPA: flagellar hook-associated protein FlgK [Candidatus Acidoferrales bacterium]|nr:flagellar hook-associated protein FlgK [Candidatus Acidoferrales bacterium]